MNNLRLEPYRAYSPKPLTKEDMGCEPACNFDPSDGVIGAQF